MARFVFSKSCLKVLSHVRKADIERLSIWLMSATVRKLKWRLARETTISSILIQHICARKIGAIGRSRSCLSRCVVWWRLACLVEYFLSFLLTWRNTRLRKASRLKTRQLRCPRSLIVLSSGNCFTRFKKICASHCCAIPFLWNVSSHFGRT